jgi:hypothetical protein
MDISLRLDVWAAPFADHYAARFRAPSTADDPALAALVKALDRDVFATREAAAWQRRQYEAKAEASLRRELAAAPTRTASAR